ncbi:hypothetical protein DXT99_11580 [Pontibacter diazotrophicus]|uniref:Uncharacterized protein n=1 Tax=Pontibacter diazotrophicus TaxID=1400979 RepID=A0A3D8LCB6_9BACT|nr:hypothetical protein [Pontibacter diazotrophicus]RDV14924.1 hypothetical protein DXT99_11580 [Pontibacter diazotrophicus]
MDEDRGVALQQLKFLGENRPAIMEEFIKHAPKAGYVFVSADHTFAAVEKPRFIRREVNKEEFVDFLEKYSQPEEKPTLPFSDQETQWVYYEVYWQHNHSSWHLKETVKGS